ncbi:hypothetical protein JQX08_19090 [Pseudomonas sp. UL073]|uniref:Rho termination factor N-terminal domain-containing protein n=1 Tax=Zestomonas insulae TaxID=2809017 RepID=A0ABS2ILI4_9GAMM|nr:hypothetical protein [Pseudomonas insulae]MBM7062825.1 hypothetical protein [Pseudomonas insulae]
MAKRIRMEMARPARQKLAALPELPPFLEEDLNAAREALFAFLADYSRQPMRWGLARFEDLLLPYRERYDLAWRRVEDYSRNPEKHLTQRLALLALIEFKDIVVSEHHSQLGKQPRGDRSSSDGQKWSCAEIAEAARRMGYANSSAKKELIQRLMSLSGKGCRTVQRALCKHDVSRHNKRKESA